MIEESTRAQLPQQLVQRIRAGLQPAALLAAITDAAVHNVQPYPDVGFKYHVVMMLRAIDATRQHAAGAEKWLPLLWASDYFKATQAEERSSSGWRLQARRPVSGIDAARARERLVAALDRWDRDAADAAIVDFAAVASAHEIFAVLFQYGARDLRAIGHKAITVATAHSLLPWLDRTQTVSLLRSTVAALQNSVGGPDPATHELTPDRSFREIRRELKEQSSAGATAEPADARAASLSAGDAAELRAALYRESPPAAAANALGLLRRGKPAQALWPVLFDTAAELIIAQPGIVALHAQTSANALYYAYRVCGDAPTRILALLQCAAFVAMFRAISRTADHQVDLAREQPLEASRGEALEAILADLTVEQRGRAAQRTLGYLQSGGDAAALIGALRRTVIEQADEPHDYKYPEAVFDTYASIPQPAWQQRFLAAGMALFKAPVPRPTPLIEECRRLLQG